MFRICPKCRTPSSQVESNCWVCDRSFDGTEPIIRSLPVNRRAAWEVRELPFRAQAIPRRKSA
jgi:hypothetical protein